MKWATWAPGQSKPLAVTFKANQRGKVCNTATATSSNAGKVSDDACTVVLLPGLKVEKAGTKEQICRNADYECGEQHGRHDVEQRGGERRARWRRRRSWPPGATLSGNKTWTIAELKPGAKVSQTVKLTSKVAGNHCNTVTASAGSLNETAKASHAVEGHRGSAAGSGG
ncbi:MAG: hypothetical protein U1F83_00395 [Verrucomicrobiota bacterium]